MKYNNDKSRDYTNPSLPTGDPTLDATLALGGDLLPQLLTAVGGAPPARHRGDPSATARLTPAGEKKIQSFFSANYTPKN